jgi:Terminase large subunit, T4likevirus-type, N-terminal
MTAAAPLALAAADLLGGFDPVVLCRRGGIEPDPWQAEVLRSTAPRLLLSCSRQSGKSLTTAWLAAHQALHSPGSLTLILAPALRQSVETFRKVVDAYTALGRPVPADSATRLALQLGNGSRVVALPGANEDTVRGYSGVDLLICDEASRISDALYYSIRPMLAVSEGRLIALSTPNGMLGWFYESWTTGGDRWQRVRVTAHECPRISAAFLEAERASMPASVFGQEYLCEFAAIEDGAFLAEHVWGMLSDDVAPRFPAPPPPAAPSSLDVYLA